MPKKIVEKWRAKEWYHVIAPKMFNEIDLGEVTATTPEQLVNRVMRISLKDITRDFSHVYTTLRLRVSEVRGRNAYTKFIGHEVAREWLATVVRRRQEVVDLVLDARSKDNVDFVLKAFIVTSQRCSQEKRRALRRVFSEIVRGKASDTVFPSFIQDALTGKLSSEVASRLKGIVPLHRVEIRASELKESFDVPSKEPFKEAAPESVEVVEAEAPGAPAPLAPEPVSPGASSEQQPEQRAG